MGSKGQNTKGMKDGKGTMLPTPTKGGAGKDSAVKGAAPNLLQTTTPTSAAPDLLQTTTPAPDNRPNVEIQVTEESQPKQEEMPEPKQDEMPEPKQEEEPETTDDSATTLTRSQRQPQVLTLLPRIAPKAQPESGKGNKGKSDAKGKAGQTMVSIVRDANPPRPHANTRQLQKHDTDEQIQDSLRRNFHPHGFGYTETHLKVVDGKTLVDQLRADIYYWRAHDEFKIGKLYHRDMRQKYAPEADPRNVLKANPTTQPPASAERRAAVAGLKAHQVDRQPILDYTMFSVKLPTQREVIGIYKTLLDLKVTTTAGNVRVWIEVMKWVCRHELDKKYRTETDCMKAYWNEAIAEQYTNMARLGGTFEEFWALYRDTCRLVVSVDDVDELMRVTGANFLGWKATVNRVVSSGAFGRMAFRSWGRFLIAEDVTAIINKHVAKLRALQGAWARKMIYDTKVAIAGEVQPLHNLWMLGNKRSVTTSFLDKVEMEMPVDTYQPQANNAIENLIRPDGVPARAHSEHVGRGLPVRVAPGEREDCRPDRA